MIVGVMDLFSMRNCPLTTSQESLFFATEAMFIMQWSRISDRVGRKPVLLTGVGGLCISMLLFGLSKTFLALVLRLVDYVLVSIPVY